MREKRVMTRRWISVGFHNGKLKVLPSLWNFPKITAKQLIDKWYVEDKKSGVSPFYYLTAKHVEHLGTQNNKGLGGMNLRQMKSMIKVVERLGREKGRFRDMDGKHLNNEYEKVVWETVGPIILRKYGPKNREAEMSWKTVYNNISKAKAFGNDD